MLINLWSTHDSILVKLNAFVILRVYAKINPQQNLESILKKTYVAYVNNAKTVTWRNYELLIFMANCFVILIINFFFYLFNIFNI